MTCSLQSVMFPRLWQTSYVFPLLLRYGGEVKPFLLISSRDDDRLAAEEYASYCGLTNLEPADLEQRRIERTPLGEVSLEHYSGILLAGSPFTVSEATANKSAIELRVEAELSALLDAVVEADFPFLGICYGIGTIGRHQGAVIDRSFGETVQATRVHLTTDGREDPLFRELPAEFDAYVGHKEAVTTITPKLTVLASSKGCPVQAFRVKKNIYATQFHPELDPVSMSSRVQAYANHGYFDPSEVNVLLSRIQRADVHASQRVLKRFVELYRREQQG